eukprot:3060392-Amphidinium_carterae.1
MHWANIFASAPVFSAIGRTVASSESTQALADSVEASLASKSTGRLGEMASRVMCPQTTGSCKRYTDGAWPWTL